MKILLIRGPNNKKAIDLSHYSSSEPRGLQNLASYFSEEHEVEIFDMAIDKASLRDKVISSNYDLCGISSACNDIFIIKKLAREIKKIKNIPVFIGGFQVKKTPELFISKYIDYIILETTKNNLQLMLKEVGENISFSVSGIIKKNQKIEKSQFVDENFDVDRRLTEKYEKSYSYFIYNKVALVNFLGNSNIYSELQNLNQKNIVFIDWDFFQDKEKVIDFFQRIERESIKKEFLVYGTIENIKNHLDKISHYRKLGLRSILIFFDKEKEEDIKIVRELEKNNIRVWGYFNIYPEFSKLDFKNLRQYIKKLGISIVTMYPLNPFYDKALLIKYEKRLLFKNEIRANRYPGYVLIKPFFMPLKTFYIEIFRLICYSYRYSLFKFPLDYGLKNSFLFFLKSIRIFMKFIKIITMNKKG